MLLVAALFLALLIAGVWLGELSWRAAGGFFLTPCVLFPVILLSGMSPMILMVALALLDIILVLMIFKGDLRIR